jgi:hypothetical protein
MNRRDGVAARLMSSSGIISILFRNSEPGVFYDPSDLTTMFTDTAGTTPVTTPGQTVALLLDKSKGLVLGSELITPIANQDFSSDTGYWTKGSGATISGGKANFSASFGYALYRGIISGVAVGGYYEITFTVSDYVSGSIRPYLGSTPSFGASVSANGTYTVRLAPTAGGEAGFNSASAFTGSIDNFSIKAITGNHATQATTASRPTYGIVPLGGRRNLLTYTEQFDNAAWTKAAGVTVSSNTDTAPDGTLTADMLTSGGNEITQNVSCATSTVYTDSLYFKKTTGAAYTPGMYLLFTGGTTTIYAARLDTNTGVATAISAGGFTAPSAVVVSDAGSYWRLSVSGSSLNNTTAGLRLYANMNSGGGAFAGSQIIWGAQLELGSVATAYQRVGTAFDVTEAGVQSLSYLFFDGIDDFLVTPTITPGIDKAQVFAGVRKLSAAAMVIAEFSSNYSITGALGMFCEGGPGPANNYAFGGGGTVLATVFAYPFIAPISNVVSAVIDIPNDDIKLRVNGSQLGQSTSNLGGGNFLAYPLYIGSRAGSFALFNGNIYSLIVRFGANLTTTQITNTERYVNKKTGAY